MSSSALEKRLDEELGEEIPAGRQCERALSTGGITYSTGNGTELGSGTGGSR